VPEKKVIHTVAVDIPRGHPSDYGHPSARISGKKNVTYGDGCLSEDPKELIRVYEGKIERGRPKDKLEPEKKYTTM